MPLKRICELKPGEKFYRGVTLCYVSRIEDGLLYFAEWYERGFRVETRRLYYRSGSKEFVQVPSM